MYTAEHTHTYMDAYGYAAEWKLDWEITYRRYHLAAYQFAVNSDVEFEPAR